MVLFVVLRGVLLSLFVVFKRVFVFIVFFGFFGFVIFVCSFILDLVFFFVGDGLIIVS